jgi:hypothetical protein
MRPYLQQHAARMVAEHAAGGSEVYNFGPTDHQLATKLGFEVVHLATERRLRGVQALLGGDGNEVAQIHDADPYGHTFKVWIPRNKVFFKRRREAYFSSQRPTHSAKRFIRIYSNQGPSRTTDSDQPGMAHPSGAAKGQAPQQKEMT